MIQDPSKFVPNRWLVTLQSGDQHVIEAAYLRSATRQAKAKWGAALLKQVRPATGTECERAANNFVRGTIEAVKQ